MVLQTTGWLEYFESLAPVTGVFVLDLLIFFFKDVLSTKFGQIIFETLAAFTLPAISLILYEGTRRQMSQFALALYMAVAQFVGIAFATPIYFYYIYKSGEPKVAVSSYRTVMNLLNFLVTCYFMYLVVKNVGTSDSESEVANFVLFLCFPVAAHAVSILVDNDFYMSNKFGAAPDWLNFIPYDVSIVMGTLYHHKFLRMLFVDREGGDFVYHVLLNGSSFFLLLDMIGLILGCYLYLWFVISKSEDYNLWKPVIVKSIPILLLCGPAAHISLACIYREAAITEKQKRA
eukprot:CAMPEP_0204825610 /NCGR_PEP_ID=MMETSP1346-20131115/3462_1 /ASSEMBLY_ACC=CAM_ASM_000771 /TAXON_ID=215587 /ORGANISM="Aplanochytrium stocchinoi, Strain GSBS06" /LENGTH=288 /DNA_ID=CAMNT_0051953297 /DNA_START=135 /DNA_END=1001 /DNA_ORIENTATION=+